LAVEFNSNKYEKHTPEQIDSILYGKPFTRVFSGFNVSGYEVATNVSGFSVSGFNVSEFKVSGHGTKPKRFTIGFVAACVNGNMNPVRKRSCFVMNPKTFALV
jgi:hypothetical protein